MQRPTLCCRQRYGRDVLAGREVLLPADNSALHTPLKRKGVVVIMLLVARTLAGKAFEHDIVRGIILYPTCTPPTLLSCAYITWLDDRRSFSLFNPFVFCCCMLEEEKNERERDRRDWD